MAPPPLNLLAQAVRLFGMGQLEPAAQACATMARLQPNSADPLYLLGVIRDRQGRAGEAVDSFTRFVTLKRAVNPRRRSFEDQSGDVGDPPAREAPRTLVIGAHERG